MENRQQERTNLDPLELVFEQVQTESGKMENVLVIFEEVSKNGIRFRTNVEFQPDERVEFHLPSLNLQSLICGRIAWKQKTESDEFLYGLQVLNGQNDRGEPPIGGQPEQP